MTEELSPRPDIKESKADKLSFLKDFSTKTDDPGLQKDFELALETLQAELDQSRIDRETAINIALIIATQFNATSMVVQLLDKDADSEFCITVETLSRFTKVPWTMDESSLINAGWICFNAYRLVGSVIWNSLLAARFKLAPRRPSEPSEDCSLSVSADEDSQEGFPPLELTSGLPVSTPVTFRVPPALDHKHSGPAAVTTDQAIDAGLKDQPVEMVAEIKKDVPSKKKTVRFAVGLSYEDIDHGDYEEIRELILRGYPSDYLPLFLARAVEEHDDEMVGILLKKRVDPEACKEGDPAPLQMACWAGNTAIIALLLEAKADTEVCSAEGDTALLTAVRQKNAAAAQLLIDAGANMYAQDKKGETIFKLGTKNGTLFYEELIRPILYANLRAEKGILPAAQHLPKYLHKAVKDQDTELVERLVNKQIDINIKNKRGWTPLLQACIQGNDKIMRLLLEAKANTELSSLNGNTPLLLAVKQGSVARTRLLLAYGASLDTSDKLGQTPLSVAEESSLACFKVLKAALGAPEPVADEKHMQVRLHLPHGPDLFSRRSSPPPAALSENHSQLNIQDFELEGGAAVAEEEARNARPACCIIC